MRAKAAKLPLAAAALGIGTLTLALAAPAPPPASLTVPPPPPARGPVATYDAACARCHGPNGSFYGPTLGKGKTDAQLRQVIKEMAEGPSQLPPLPPVELEAQTAYHRALMKGEPFLAVTLRTDTRIEGEVTAGATVSLTVGDKAAAAKVEGSRWSAPLSPGGPAPRITARIGKAATLLDTARASFSHTAPLTTAAPETVKNAAGSTTGKTTP